MNTGIPERFTDEDGELAEPLSREEVEDLFSPGTVLLDRGRAYHVDELLSGPELLGTVEKDDSLWVTTEEGRNALVVGNALHNLVSGTWAYARDPEEVYEKYTECDECGIYRRPGGVVGEFVPGASFCSEDCRDAYLDRETDEDSEVVTDGGYDSPEAGFYRAVDTRTRAETPEAHVQVTESRNAVVAYPPGGVVRDNEAIVLVVEDFLRPPYIELERVEQEETPFGDDIPPHSDDEQDPDTSEEERSHV